MPPPTATTTRRGSFPGAGLAIPARASSDVSPRDGAVARGGPRGMPAGRYAPFLAPGWDEPPQFAGVEARGLGARLSGAGVAIAEAVAERL